MDIYYRGFDSDSPITSATKHLSSFAVRLLLSMLRSIKHLDDAAFDALMKVVSIDNLWALCIILGGWMLSALIGGPVGAAVSAILLYLGVREFYERIAEIYTPPKAASYAGPNWWQMSASVTMAHHRVNRVSRP